MNWSKSFSSILVGLRSHGRNCWGMTHRTDGLCESMFFCLSLRHPDLQVSMIQACFSTSYPLPPSAFDQIQSLMLTTNFTVYRVESFSGLEGPLWLTAQGGSSRLRLMSRWAFVVLNKHKWKRKWRDYRGITSALVWFIYCVERRWKHENHLSATYYWNKPREQLELWERFLQARRNKIWCKHTNITSLLYNWTQQKFTNDISAIFRATVCSKTFLL